MINPHLKRDTGKETRSMQLTNTQYLKVRLDPYGGLEFILTEYPPNGIRRSVSQIVSSKNLRLAQNVAVQLEVLQEYLHRKLTEPNFVV